MSSRQMRSQRSFAPVAPKFSSAHYEPIEKPVFTYKKVTSKTEWRPDPYTQMLYDHMFKKWAPDNT